MRHSAIFYAVLLLFSLQLTSNRKGDSHPLTKTPYSLSCQHYVLPGRKGCKVESAGADSSSWRTCRHCGYASREFPLDNPLCTFCSALNLAPKVRPSASSGG